MEFGKLNLIGHTLRRVETHPVACAFLIAVISLGVTCALAGQEEFGEVMRQAQQLESQGRYREAAAIYEDLAHRFPHSAQVLNNLGVAYAQMGEYRQAATAYERALRLEPHSVALLVNLGLAYFKSGQFHKAAQPLSRAVVAAPGKLSSPNFVGHVLLRVERFCLGQSRVRKSGRHRTF